MQLLQSLIQEAKSLTNPPSKCDHYYKMEGGGLVLKGIVIVLRLYMYASCVGLLTMVIKGVFRIMSALLVVVDPYDPPKMISLQLIANFTRNLKKFLVIV